MELIYGTRKRKAQRNSKWNGLAQKHFRET